MRKSLESLLIVSSLLFSSCSFSIKDKEYSNYAKDISAQYQQSYQKLDAQGYPNTISPIFILEFSKRQRER